jgi:cell division protein FtsL
MFIIITILIFIILILALWITILSVKDNPIDNDPELDEQSKNLRDVFEKLKRAGKGNNR